MPTDRLAHFHDSLTPFLSFCHPSNCLPDKHIGFFHSSQGYITCKH
ncbi:hypothetical protein HMPREF0971_01515 [Segatella oris F0302]|uniref:Uncharacterized protein n=1 Tax=Segatella oris F0302 TaxID=649760 RepID=D1QRB1_9BACT|nr:hypothetical protein HMPREF0971_01515 [Segatella oris F0302]